MSVALETFRHPQLGFTIDLVPGLDLHTDIPGIALLAREAEDAVQPGTFRANLTVVGERLKAGTTLDAYVRGSLAVQERTLEAPRLVDREETDLGGAPCVRTLLHHHLGTDLAVVAEQWRLVAGELGWVITATADALLQAETAETLSAMAESFRSGEER